MRDLKWLFSCFFNSDGKKLLIPAAIVLLIVVLCIYYPKYDKFAEILVENKSDHAADIELLSGTSKYHITSLGVGRVEHIKFTADFKLGYKSVINVHLYNGTDFKEIDSGIHNGEKMKLIITNTRVHPIMILTTP